MRRFPRHLLALAVIVWSGWFVWSAERQWSRDRACLLFAGPWLPCGPGPDAWHLPLLLAALPFVLLGLVLLWRAGVHLNKLRAA